MKLSDFRKLLDENPWIREIELSNYGEIFLNPELSAIMREAFDRDVRLYADNGVNLNRVNECLLEDLVRFKFQSMACSIDGASCETYRVYRVGGNFETVIENIKTINRLKEKHRSKYPYLLWQFVVFGHNEHEIPTARKLARELGMDFRLKLSWDMNFSPVRDRQFVMKQFGLRAATRKEFKQVYGVDYCQPYCNELWDLPQVNWNGELLGCSRNFWGDFGGNAFESGLVNVLNDEKIEYARDMLVGKRAARADIPCTTCEIYMGMKRNQRWLKRGLRGWSMRQITKLRRFGLDGIMGYVARQFPLK